MRHQIAHSYIGHVVSRMIRAVMYPNARAHWVRDCMAGDQPWSALKNYKA